MSDPSPSNCSGFVWAWLHTTLEILIPKQRGKGWLKVPAGHHAEARLREIEDAAECDVFGLDGTLTIECGGKVTCYPDCRQRLTARLFPVISREYKTRPDREVSFAFIERELNGPNASHQAPAALDAAITQDASSRLPACAGSPSNDKPSTTNQ